MNELLSKIKKNLDIYIFYLLIAFLPFQLHIPGTQNLFDLPEYINPSFFFLYLSDILIIFILFFGIIKYIKNKQKNNREHSYKSIIYFIIWTFLSIFWAQYRGIALFFTTKLLIFILLAIYIKNQIQNREDILNKTLFIVFYSGFIQSIIGIYQFIFQKAIGLKILGEPVLGQNLPGIAKLDYNGEKIIRAYGTMPHPNILGGFLLLSIAFVAVLLLKQTRNKKMLSFLLIPQIICFILTFSRSAWLALFTASSIFFIINKIKRGNSYINSKIKSQKSKLQLKTKNNLLKIIVLIFTITTIIIFLYPLIQLRLTSFEKAIQDRKVFTQTAIEMIKKEPFLGIGWGNYLLRINDFYKKPLEYWQYQPAHNIYLLVLAESGIIGLFFFLLFISDILKKASTQITKNPQKTIFLSLFIGFLIIGLLDHYFLTIQRGQIIFWIAVGFLL